MDTTIPPITDQDREDYQFFLTKVAEISDKEQLPIEWFAIVDKLRIFGLPAVDFPGRASVAEFKAIVEEVDKQYKKGNPLPLRQFVQEVRGSHSETKALGPLASKAHSDAKPTGVIVRDGRRAVFKKVPHRVYKNLIADARATLETMPRDYVLVFIAVQDGVTFETIERPQGVPTTPKPSTGYYTLDALDTLLEEANGWHEQKQAMDIGREFMTHRDSVEKRREKEREWARMAKGVRKVDLSNPEWQDGWVKLHSEGALDDLAKSARNIFMAGPRNAATVHTNFLESIERNVRDFKLPFGTGASMYDGVDDLVARQACLLLWRHTGVPCEKPAEHWPVNVFGPAEMNYQILLRQLQMFLFRHDIPLDAGKFDVVRFRINGDHDCETRGVGETSGTSFKGGEMEELGVQFTPSRKFKGGGMYFANGVPIKYSHLVRGGKDGGWHTYLFPLTTNSDGTGVYLLHDDAGDVRGLMTEKPTAGDRRGGMQGWTRVVQPFSNMY